MPYWSKDSQSAVVALSDYEAALFKKILKKEIAEKVQTQPANDGDKLSYLFAVFN
jgi:hypothetical protein